MAVRIHVKTTPNGYERSYMARVKHRSKYFSISKYGESAAKEMAYAAEAKLLEHYGLPPRTRLDAQAPSTLYATNKSGMNGMTVIWRKTFKGSDKEVPYLAVSMRSESTGKPTKRFYSIAKNGIAASALIGIILRKQQGLATKPLEHCVSCIENILGQSAQE